MIFDTKGDSQQKEPPKQKKGEITVYSPIPSLSHLFLALSITQSKWQKEGKGIYTSWSPGRVEVVREWVWKESHLPNCDSLTLHTALTHSASIWSSDLNRHVIIITLIIPNHFSPLFFIFSISPF